MKKSNAIAGGAPQASARIYDALHKRVEKLQPGARLPSVRELTVRFEASPVTVQRALAQLAREGKVVTRPGDGTFVAEPQRASTPVDVGFQTLALGAAPPTLDLLGTPLGMPAREVIPLGTGYMDLESQPLALLRLATTRAARREHAWSRVPPEGIEPLRAWFAREIGGELAARQVQIVPGGQAALSCVIRALVPAGGPLVFEAPTYFGALAIARAAGIRPVPVACDDDGIVPELLEATLAHTGARAVYLQPRFANPTGVTMSAARRTAIVEVARRAGVFLVEDDYAYDLTIEGSAAPPLFRACPSHVIYIRSLTKTAAPGLRIAAIAALGPVLERLRSARAVDDFFVSGMLQEAALELVSASGWPRHIARLRVLLRQRRDAAVEAVRAEKALTLRHVPKGGFSLWLGLPAGVDDAAVARAAEISGVHVNPGRAWFPAEPLGPHLRVSYAAAQPRELREGIRMLGRVVAEHLT